MVRPEAERSWGGEGGVSFDMLAGNIEERMEE